MVEKNYKVDEYLSFKVKKDSDGEIFIRLNHKYDSRKCFIILED